jgi:hypothetical protein
MLENGFYKNMYHCETMSFDASSFLRKMRKRFLPKIDIERAGRSREMNKRLNNTHTEARDTHPFESNA